MKSLLIIGYVFPEPNSSAAGTRMMQLISLFSSFDYKIIFATAAKNLEFSENLINQNIKVETILLNDERFDAFITNVKPTIVLFDRYMMEEQYGWRVSENCPDAIKILDTEDLHFLRYARQIALKSKTLYNENDLYNEITKREIASILRCDLSLLVSEFEINILENQFRIDPNILHYLPIFASKTKGAIPNFQERENFVFVGNCLHEPNWDCIQYLSSTIWPLIHKNLPIVKMFIYGAYTSQKVLQLHSPKNNFLIMGRAENAIEVVKKARIALAPLRFGAGIKGKLLEAMQCGTPSITSTIGAEGIYDASKWNGFVEDDATAFANAAVMLYNEKQEWKKSQAQGFTILSERFEKKIYANAFLSKIKNIKTNLKSHRQQNFMGTILQHQLLNSTKYMSKWIEEKNKKPT